MYATTAQAAEHAQNTTTRNVAFLQVLLTCPLLTEKHEITLYNNDTNGQINAQALINVGNSNVECYGNPAVIAMYCPNKEIWEYVPDQDVPNAEDLFYAMIDRGEIDRYACVVIVELDPVF